MSRTRLDEAQNVQKTAGLAGKTQLRCGPRRTDRRTSGWTRAVSISQAARSCRRPSTPCSRGIKRPSSASPSSKIMSTRLVSPQASSIPARTLFAIADGLRGDGRFRSYLRRGGYSSSTRTGCLLAQGLSCWIRYRLLRGSTQCTYKTEAGKKQISQKGYHGLLKERRQDRRILLTAYSECLAFTCPYFTARAVTAPSSGCRKKSSRSLTITRSSPGAGETTQKLDRGMNHPTWFSAPLHHIHHNSKDLTTYRLILATKKNHTQSQTKESEYDCLS